MRFLPLFVLLFLAAGAVSACEAHDYWFVDAPLVVDASQNILTTSMEEPLSQELFVRYQVDYEIENLDSTPTEVVVSATSYVNRIERSTSQKTWHLESGEVGQGILPASQLQLGNSLSISLQCCQASLCPPKEVLCPVSTQMFSDTNALATFCYDACKDVQPCIQQCPSEEACLKKCGEEADFDTCMDKNCAHGSSVASCDYQCQGDESCLNECKPSTKCQNTCYSLASSCFRNCLSSWNRCTDTETYTSPSTKVPCALCNDNDFNPGTGLCDMNLSEEIQEYYTISNGTTSFTCTPDCSQYPSVCMSECTSLYAEDGERMECLSACLDQHLYWCNDGYIPTDYIEPNGEQPCCYETACHNTLSAVIKSFDVSCFNDTDCQSGSTCSDAGVCVASSSGSCSTASKPADFHWFWLILPAAALLHRNRRRHA